MLSRSRALSLHLLLCSALVFAVAGCGKKKPKAETRLPVSALTDASGSGMGPSVWDPTGAPGENSLANGGTMNTLGGFGGATDPDTGDLLNATNTSGVEDGTFLSELEMIHFEFDRSEISPEWQTVLNGHAAWIAQNPSVMVQVEGHCDERGTEEYNLSLGQRRADAVRTYLVSQGVDPNRMSTISYGKMRPLSFETDEQAHSLNRRAMFLVYEIDGGAVASAY